MEQETIKVVIIDRKPEIGQRIVQLFDENKSFPLLAITIDAENAFSFLKSNKADIIILDIDLPKRTCYKLFFLFKIMRSSAKIIALSNRPDYYKRSIYKLFKVDHFFDKTNEFEKIPSSIMDFYTKG